MLCWRWPLWLITHPCHERLQQGSQSPRSLVVLVVKTKKKTSSFATGRVGGWVSRWIKQSKWKRSWLPKFTGIESVFASKGCSRKVGHFLTVSSCLYRVSFTLFACLSSVRACFCDQVRETADLRRDVRRCSVSIQGTCSSRCETRQHPYDRGSYPS